MLDLTPYVSLIAALIGGVTGGSFALLGVTRTLRNQYRLEVLRDRQSLRNATRDRLRETYAIVFLAAATMDSVAQRALSLWGNKDQVAALTEELRALREDLNRASVRLMLEHHATDVTVAFRQVSQAFTDFQNHYFILQQDLVSDRPKQVEEVRKRRDQLEALIEELRKTMLRSLAPLDEPILDDDHDHGWGLWWRR